MDKKYQVFVSSTYEDLKPERSQVIKAILEMGHIPVGMEMFSAADEEQWKLIERQIEESDYYVVVVAQKYGSVMPDGTSYTEKEYDLAVGVGVPVLGFVLDDGATWPTKLNEDSPKARKSLALFKKKIKSKLVSFWTNSDDLHAKVSISLMKSMNTTPRVGWVRSSGVASAKVVLELSRLSGENSSMRTELAKIQTIAAEQADEIRNVFLILHRNEFTFGVRKTKEWDGASKNTCTLLEIFEAVAPYLLDENSVLGMAQNIALKLEGTKYYKAYPIGKNKVSEWAADMATLDLIEPSKKKHSVRDKESYWCLTKFGKKVLKRTRRIRLEEGLASDGEMPEESD